MSEIKNISKLNQLLIVYCKNTKETYQMTYLNSNNIYFESI